MKKAINRLIAVFVILSLFFVNSSLVYAHPHAEDHDKDLEKVLFDSSFSKYKSNNVKEKLKCIEYASYLTIDQFGEDGKDKYDYLKEHDISGLPMRFDSIKYNEDMSGQTKKDGSKVKISAQNHRKYTHQGWQREYSGKDINRFIERRRDVLNATVNSVFEMKKLSKVRGYDEKCISLAGIIYYVHILGDYDEADNYKKIALLVPLAGNQDKDRSAEYMIPTMKTYIETVFPDQKKTDDYKKLIKELDEIEKTAAKLYDSTGGVNTDEEFEVYHQCADDILESLKNHLPQLLKNESFFYDVFYQG